MPGNRPRLAADDTGEDDGPPGRRRRPVAGVLALPQVRCRARQAVAGRVAAACLPAKLEPAGAARVNLRSPRIVVGVVLAGVLDPPLTVVRFGAGCAPHRPLPSSRDLWQRTVAADASALQLRPNARLAFRCALTALSFPCLLTLAFALAVATSRGMTATSGDQGEFPRAVLTPPDLRLHAFCSPSCWSSRSCKLMSPSRPLRESWYGPAGAILLSAPGTAQRRSTRRYA